MPRVINEGSILNKIELEDDGEQKMEVIADVPRHDGDSVSDPIDISNNNFGPDFLELREALVKSGWAILPTKNVLPPQVSRRYVYALVHPEAIPEFNPNAPPDMSGGLELNDHFYLHPQQVLMSKKKGIFDDYLSNSEKNGTSTIISSKFSKVKIEKSPPLPSGLSKSVSSSSSKSPASSKPKKYISILDPDYYDTDYYDNLEQEAGI